MRCGGKTVPARLSQQRGAGGILRRAAYLVTVDEVEIVYSNYYCRCKAEYTLRGQRRVHDSPRSLIKYAFMDDIFRQFPIESSVAQGESFELMCQPPDASPPPTVYWLQNNQRLETGGDTRFVISSVNSLLITAAELQDSAVYVCVAFNVAGERRTPPARLTVVVNGGWSEWGTWSGCSREGCTKPSRSRYRTCTQPPPGVGGADCQGSASQQQPCPCPAVGVTGWGEWGHWSSCDINCRRFRERPCNEPLVVSTGQDILCPGSGVEHAQCKMQDGVCSGVMANQVNYNSKSNVSLYVGLSVGLVATLAGFLLVIVLLRRRAECIRSERSRLPSQCTANNGFGVEDEKKYAELLLVQPDLGQFCAGSRDSAPRTSSADTSVETKQPLLHSSSSSASSYCQHCSSQHYSAQPCSLQAQLCANCAQQASVRPFTPVAPSSDNNEYEKLPQSFSSCYQEPADCGPSRPVPAARTVAQHGPLPPTPCQHLQRESSSPGRNRPDTAFVCGQIGFAGGKLTLPESGLTLTLGEGCLPPGPPRQLFLAVSRNDLDRPSLTDAQTQLSAVITCGPADVALRKPAVISFGHCASARQQPWLMTVVTSDTPLDQPALWQASVVLGQETLNTGLYCQVDTARCHLLTEHLGRYALLGQSQAGRIASKLLRVVAFCSRASSLQLSVRVYCVEDTADALQHVLETESFLGGRLLDEPRQLALEDGAGDLCFCMEELNEGWRCRTRVQEIPLTHVWRGSGTLHCSFTLERRSGSEHAFQELSFRVHVYQKQRLPQQQVLHVCLPSTAELEQQPGISLADNHSDEGRSTLLTQRGVVFSNAEGGLFRMSGALRRQLCTLLDTPQARANDWRMLAHALNVDRYINFFATKPSPSDTILDVWDARHTDDQSAAAELLAALRGMERTDCVALLQRSHATWI